MVRNVFRVLVLAVATAGSLNGAYALMPLARPAAFPDFDPGSSAPFADSWAITMPTMDVDIPDTVLASCKLPVRIEAADESHIFYLGPRETEPSAAMELQRLNGGAMWEPIAGGPSFFAFWVSEDMFYLYDEVPQADEDWGWPYVYRRCPAGNS